MTNQLIQVTLPGRMTQEATLASFILKRKMCPACFREYSNGTRVGASNLIIQHPMPRLCAKRKSPDDGGTLTPLREFTIYPVPNVLSYHLFLNICILLPCNSIPIMSRARKKVSERQALPPSTSGI